MRKTIYICDICKKEYNDLNDLCDMFIGMKRYETCPECTTKLEQVKQKYEKQYKKVTNDFNKELEEITKEK